MTKEDFKSKKEAAKMLGISPGRVSHYIKMGMPVEPDGKIDTRKAMLWRDQNIGVVRMPKGFGRSVYPAKPPQPTGQAPMRTAETATAAMEIAGHALAVLGEQLQGLLLRRGLSVREAYLLTHVAAGRLELELHRWLEARGLLLGLGLPPQVDALDWKALAAEAGDVFDEESWDWEVEQLLFPKGGVQ